MAPRPPRSTRVPLKKLTGDPLAGLKWAALRTVRFDHDSKEVTWSRLVAVSKWRLCHARGLLTKDPVWDRYLDEEIVAEALALRFEEDPKFADAFEASTRIVSEDEASWLERMEQEALAKEDAEPSADAPTLGDDLGFSEVFE